MNGGVTEEKLLAIVEYLGLPLYSPKEKIALEYAEKITLSDEEVSNALFARVQEHFPTEGEIVTLTASIAFENLRSKPNNALRIEAHGFCVMPSPFRSGPPNFP